MEKFLDEIKLFWEALPQEVRVACYIAASYALSEIILLLSTIQVDSRILTFAINILLVFLKQIKPRMEIRREEKEFEEELEEENL